MLNNHITSLSESSELKSGHFTIADKTPWTCHYGVTLQRGNTSSESPANRDPAKRVTALRAGQLSRREAHKVGTYSHYIQLHSTFRTDRH